jgi:hypothetical protein
MQLLTLTRRKKKSGKALTGIHIALVECSQVGQERTQAPFSSLPTDNCTVQQKSQ